MEDISDFEFEFLKKRVKQESDRKIFEKVFDKQTVMVLHSLAVKGLFDKLEHIVSTGKEAHVFAAVDLAGNSRAIKIFKKETSDFRKMGDYIIGDKRFREMKYDKRALINAWTKKEYKNLLIASKAKLPVPLPLGQKENIIVMEFIGGNNEPWPKLKDTKPTKKQLLIYKEKLIEFTAGLYLAGLVHADLSEYNVLAKGEDITVIDFAQALLLNHPKAREYFERDITNLANYFTKNKVETSFEELYAEVKKKKEEMEKQTQKK